jgi:hypothetical protein
MDQLAGNVGHRRAQALVVRHRAAQGGGADSASSNLSRTGPICPLNTGENPTQPGLRNTKDYVWFEDRWMVASLCDE